MDRNQAKKLLPVIQAYIDGKPIQSRCIKGDKSLWYDDEDSSFDDDFEYRIKPDSKPESKTDVNYRPFKGSEECWAEIQKHQPFGWVKDRNGGKFVIGAVDSDNTIFVCDYGTRTFDEVFKYYIFSDGTPFGVKVEE